MHIVSQMKLKRVMPEPEPTSKLSASKPSLLRRNTKKKIDEPIVFIPMEEEKLLDGTPFLSIRDPVKTMERLVIPPDANAGHLYFKIGSEIDEEAVTISIIEAFEIKEKRSELHQRVMKDSVYIWDKSMEEIKMKIQTKIEQLNRERIKHIAEFESHSVELEKLMMTRIEQLPQIQLGHQNEAHFLIDTIHDIRAGFTSRVENIYNDMSAFSIGGIKVALLKLSKCPTAKEVKKLREIFSLQVERFNFDTSDAIERASLDFDHGKKMLEKSKIQGNHSSAWIIVKETGAYDPDGRVMENWFVSVLISRKMVVGEDISRAEKDIAFEIKSALKEFDQYLVDLEFVEATKYKVANLRTLLRAESLSCQSKIRAISQSISTFKESASAHKSWTQTLDFIAKSIELNNEASKISDYLSLTKSISGFAFSSICRPSKYSWLEWKESLDLEGSSSLEDRQRRLSHGSMAMSQSIFIRTESTIMELEKSRPNSATTNKNSTAAQSKANLNTRYANTPVTRGGTRGLAKTPNKDLPALPTKMGTAASRLEEAHDLDAMFKVWVEIAKYKIMESHEV